MPQTIGKTKKGQIIGGIFTTREKADEAAEALREAGVPTDDVQVIVQRNVDEPGEIYTDILSETGFADTPAHFYSKAVHEGKVLVVASNITDPADIIDLFDRFKAEYNPNGSRNVREDVAGMTLGAGVGAITGALVGAAVAGPIGVAAGTAAGAVLGGGSGAAVGKFAEHRK